MVSKDRLSRKLAWAETRVLVTNSVQSFGKWVNVMKERVRDTRSNSRANPPNRYGQQKLRNLVDSVRLTGAARLGRIATAPILFCLEQRFLITVQGTIESCSTSRASDVYCKYGFSMGGDGEAVFGARRDLLHGAFDGGRSSTARSGSRWARRRRSDGRSSRLRSTGRTRSATT